MQNNTQDNVFMRAVVNREVLLAPFRIYVAPDDPTFEVVIPAGDYTFTDYRIGIDSGDQRKMALRVVDDDRRVLRRQAQQHRARRSPGGRRRNSASA